MEFESRKCWEVDRTGEEGDVKSLWDLKKNQTPRGTAGWRKHPIVGRTAEQNSEQGWLCTVWSPERLGTVDMSER